MQCRLRVEYNSYNIATRTGNLVIGCWVGECYTAIKPNAGRRQKQCYWKGTHPEHVRVVQNKIIEISKLWKVSIW